MGLGKPQLHAKFEVAGFIFYGSGNLFLKIGINKNILEKLKHWIRRHNVPHSMYNFCGAMIVES